MHRRRTRRLVAGVLAGTLALTTLPFLSSAAHAADPLPPVANPTAPDAVCDGAPGTNPFTDLGAESAATREVILCLVATGLTAGATPTTYNPGGDVNRRQMALFIKRLADFLREHQTGVFDLPALPAYDGTPDYSDVSASDAAAAAIGQLSQAGIIGGFPDGTFRPNDRITRRQMAAFVNRLQAFFTGSPFVANGDFFDDDNGDPGEADLNALATIGVFQGDGQGRVFPGAFLSRRQMANILLRDAEVYRSNGIIENPFEGEGEGTNQSFDVTPTAIAAIELGQTRQFTASGLDGTKRYDIALFNCANVTRGENDVFSFEAAGAAAPQNGQAAPGALVSAKLSVVNGVATASGDNIAPAGTSITFTITGNDSECATPVVFEDTADDDLLNINATTKRPTDAFGVGGNTRWVPEEAATGSSVNGEVVFVTEGLAVVQPVAPNPAVTVRFNSGDTYRERVTLPPLNIPAVQPISSAVFFQNLSTGDTLETCGGLGQAAAYTRGAANGFCLTDVAPVAPSALIATAGSPSSTAIKLDWTASAPPVDAYNVYRNPEACAQTTVAELTRIATVPAPAVTFTATGLTPGTTYCFVVTAVETNDESAVSVGSATPNNDNTVELATTAAAVPPTITSAAVTTDVLPSNEASTGDVLTLVFSEEMNPATVANTNIVVVDADGDEAQIRCGGPAVPADDITHATCVLSAGADATVNNDTLVITLLENADDVNAAGNGTLQYPLTINAITVLTDLNDGATINVIGSADRTLNVA